MDNIVLVKDSKNGEIRALSTHDILSETDGNYKHIMEVLRDTISLIVNYFENSEIEKRRSFMDMLFLELARRETSIYTLYSLFKPNMVDKLDYKYKGNPDYTFTGQYSIFIMRNENGYFLTWKNVFDHLDDHLNSSEAFLGKVSVMASKEALFFKDLKIEITEPVIAKSGKTIGIVSAVIRPNMK